LNFTIENVSFFFEKGNLAQADAICRIILSKTPNDSMAFYYLGLIAEKLHSPYHSYRFFKMAFDNDTNNELAKNKITTYKTPPSIDYFVNKENKKKFLLIKAWGCGFWADVNHVIGQLLISELTQRIPVIHWGPNSLFSNNDNENVFNSFFEPVSKYTISDLNKDNYSYFPSKWNKYNLKQEEINKFSGKNSRMASIFYLNRDEDVAISDFYSGVIDIIPWIYDEHPLYNLKVDDIYSYIIRKYLIPKVDIINKANIFFKTKINTDNFIAVHARGSDKICEIKEVGLINNVIFKSINNINDNDKLPIFLMTDDQKILDKYKLKYKDRLIYTNCNRTINDFGIHYSNFDDKILLGKEVMIDTYIAAKSSYFIGTGFSNASAIIPYFMKNNKHALLIGPNIHHDLNYTLHNR
jgi:protein O-GlcNAc transferase